MLNIYFHASEWSDDKKTVIKRTQSSCATCQRIGQRVSAGLRRRGKPFQPRQKGRWGSNRVGNEDYLRHKRKQYKKRKARANARRRLLYEQKRFTPKPPQRGSRKRRVHLTGADREANRVAYIFSTTFLPGPETFDMSALPFAEDECRHGRIGGFDGDAPCGCWRAENGREIRQREPVSRKTNGPTLGPGPDTN